MNEHTAATGRGEERVQSSDADDRYPWVAMRVVMIGMFMVILDTTIVNVALPEIGTALDRQSDVGWIVTAYLLAVGITTPASGWLADRYGRKRVFIRSLIVLIGGSILAALSLNFEMLVASRVVQGLGGGLLLPVGFVMIYELFPPDRRGRALGILGVAAMSGPVLGPFFGGYVVTIADWHWLFFVNIPIGLIAILAAKRLLRDTGYRSESSYFDAVGLLLVTSGLIICLFTFARAPDWGWRSGPTLGFLTVGFALFVAFVFWENRTAEPVMDLSHIPDSGVQPRHSRGCRDGHGAARYPRVPSIGTPDDTADVCPPCRNNAHAHGDSCRYHVPYRGIPHGPHRATDASCDWRNPAWLNRLGAESASR